MQLRTERTQVKNLRFHFIPMAPSPVVSNVRRKRNREKSASTAPISEARRPTKFLKQEGLERASLHHAKCPAKSELVKTQGSTPLLRSHTMAPTQSSQDRSTGSPATVYSPVEDLQKAQSLSWVDLITYPSSEATRKSWPPVSRLEEPEVPTVSEYEDHPFLLGSSTVSEPFWFLSSEGKSVASRGSAPSRLTGECSGYTEPVMSKSINV